MKTLEIKHEDKTFTIIDHGNDFLSIWRRDRNPYKNKVGHQSFEIARIDLARMLDVLTNVSVDQSHLYNKLTDAKAEGVE